MSDTDAGYRSTEVDRHRTSRGYFLYGCAFVLLFVVIGILALVYGAYRLYTGQLDKYTSPTPADIPEVVYSDEELAELKSQLETFRTDVERGETAEELVLTADDINALIAADQQLNDRVYIRIDDGQVGGDISVPLDAIPGGSGRYLNASATFDVSFENGVLVVTLAKAEVKGRPVPEEFLRGMANENLAKDLYRDPETAEMMRRIDEVRVEDSKIILRTLATEPTEPTDSTEPTESTEPSEAGEPGESTESTPPAEPREAAEASNAG